MTNQSQSVSGQSVQVNGERYYQITNTHQMPEFFMSLVGSSDHWMFISSLGALTAGRRDPDHALFPYAADDQLSAARHTTGPYTCITVESTKGDTSKRQRWEPFLTASAETKLQQNLYKTPLGNKLILEEVHDELGLIFRYRWAYSERFGFIRSCELINENAHNVQLELIDGIQNLLPHGLESEFTMRFSNLGNAYKKSERVADSDLGIFYLSSIPTDRAEPSEGLKATIAWQTGLAPDCILLSTQQLKKNAASNDQHQAFKDETDIRGKQGAFLACKKITLAAKTSQSWHIIADVDKDHSDVIGLNDWIQNSNDVAVQIERDILAGESHLKGIIGSVDGFQCGSNLRRLDRHISNTIFNAMRGGIPLDGYQVPKTDFRSHLKHFNREVYQKHQELIENLPEKVLCSELQRITSATNDADLTRLTQEYLPLAFSRRHGDPTRPWNRFAIQLKTESGDPNLHYQGNWRDLFQNWEALAVSFPEFSNAMINRFLNATTADGYNPYRVTKDGFDWEAPTPEDPWANIGYWGDHQIIYLLKLLEANQKTNPDQLNHCLNHKSYVHANVPYRIKSFEEIKQDPRDTIQFDEDLAATIEARINDIGADGKLLQNQSEEIQRVTMLEKLLTLTLAKMSNFVPDGGIWLNTQRPEWNDANNALVGNGLSMVTTCYLYRWCSFIESWINRWSSSADDQDFDVSVEVLDFFEAVFEILSRHSGDESEESNPLTQGGGAFEQRSPQERATIVTELGQAGSTFRSQLYQFGTSGLDGLLSVERCKAFFSIAKAHLKNTILTNRRPDALFHSYNLLRWQENGIHLDRLDEMLEGQVAILSAGILDSGSTVELLDALRQSKLYRENQNSYLLYPDKQLARFLSKNNLSPKVVESSQLLQRLLKDNEQSIIKRDHLGGFHFNGSIRNANDLRQRLCDLPETYHIDAQQESNQLIESFIELFQHHQFTGRSGTFFGYEGLGSIYWHMVSKLGLAVAENCYRAMEANASPELRDKLRSHYESIRSGIGAEKTPLQYGAFPSDPYSHTPENAGVKQPGMTGQVKEDVLTRFLETGIIISEGCIHFNFELFDQSELLETSSTLEHQRVSGQTSSITVPPGGFALTLCQVPIIYRPGKKNCITVHRVEDDPHMIEGTTICRELSQEVFARTGRVSHIELECTAIQSLNPMEAKSL